MGSAGAALSAFATCLRLDDLPSQAVDHAKLLVLDTVGVALAAVPTHLGRLMIEHVQALGGQSQATILGQGDHTSAPLAALANGTLTSALDFDAGFHLTTHTLPAALAMGECLRSSGAEMIEAFIVGYEAGARLIEAVDSDRGDGAGITARGWYHVGFVGPVVSAIVAGKLLRLDAEHLGNAIGIAAATAGGVRRNFGTMAKAFQAGNAASQGVHAAMLASAGFGGDPDVLDAPLGLFAALGVRPGQAEEALGKLGDRIELLSSLRIKRFPACTPAHRPVQAVLQLKREYAFGAEDVDSIEADLHTFSLLRLAPEDEVAAGFSAPFLLAVAIVDGELTLDQLEEDRLNDPKVRRLMSCVRQAGDSYPSGREEEGERVVVRLKDGRTLVSEARRVDRLDSRADIEAKFQGCAAKVLQPLEIEQLRQKVMNIEALQTIGDLMASTVAATA